MIPVQLPLHEPYFDLTPIKIAHTKNLDFQINTVISKKFVTSNQTYCTYLFQRLTSGQYQSDRNFTVMWCHTITSNSYFMQPNYRLQFFIILFWRLAQIHILASHCKGICGTSIAHNIKVMMTCLGPYYHNRYFGELHYLINKKS